MPKPNGGSFVAAQRRAMIEFVDEGIWRPETMRLESEPYAEIVRSPAPRLRRLMLE
jgi:hypothetical protein